MSLHLEVVESLEALEALGKAWEELDAQTYPRLPFSGPRWNLLWWKHFAETRSTVADRVHSFVLFEGEKLLAVAPMMLTERPAVGPLRTRHLQFFGADPNVTEIRGPCCRRDDEGRVMEALLSHLESRPAEWDWAGLGGFVENGPAYQALSKRIGVHWGRQVPDFLIQPGPDWEAYKTQLPRNVKESLRKCYASLKRDNLSYELKAAERPADVADALETFLRLHSARAQAPITPRHADVFAPAPSRAFLKELFSRATEAGEAKVFTLMVEGEAVASRLGFVLDDSLYLYFTGYLPRMSEYSVMTTCTVEAIKWGISKGLKTINLSPGRDQSKTRWRPVEVPLIEAQWVSPSWRGPALHKFTRTMKQRVSEAAQAPGAFGQLMRMVQRRRD